MDVRYLLENQFPLSTTEHHLSQEGFIDKLTKMFLGKSKPSGQGSPKSDMLMELENHYRWVTEVLFKKDPKTFIPREGEIIIPKTRGMFFTRNGRPIDNVIVEFSKDLKQYQDLFKKARPALMTNLRYVYKVDRDLKEFLGDADRPEEFMAKVRTLQKQAPKPLIDSFHEPRYPFLGYAQSRFVTDGEFTDWGGVAPYITEAVTVPPPIRAHMTELIKLARDIETFHIEVASIIDDPDSAGLDASDPPFRGYMDQLWTTDEDYPFFHPTFYVKNTLLPSILDKRISYLSEALQRYIRASVKNE